MINLKIIIIRTILDIMYMYRLMGSRPLSLVLGAPKVHEP
jgi:hypothetical protein